MGRGPTFPARLLHTAGSSHPRSVAPGEHGAHPSPLSSSRRVRGLGEAQRGVGIASQCLVTSSIGQIGNGGSGMLSGRKPCGSGSGVSADVCCFDPSLLVVRAASPCNGTGAPAVVTASAPQDTNGEQEACAGKVRHLDDACDKVVRPQSAAAGPEFRGHRTKDASATLHLKRTWFPATAQPPAQPSASSSALPSTCAWAGASGSGSKCKDDACGCDHVEGRSPCEKQGSSGFHVSVANQQTHEHVVPLATHGGRAHGIGGVSSIDAGSLATSWEMYGAEHMTSTGHVADPERGDEPELPIHQGCLQADALGLTSHDAGRAGAEILGPRPVAQSFTCGASGSGRQRSGSRRSGVERRCPSSGRCSVQPARTTGQAPVSLTAIGTAGDEKDQAPPPALGCIGRRTYRDLVRAVPNSSRTVGHRDADHNSVAGSVLAGEAFQACGAGEAEGRPGSAFATCEGMMAAAFSGGVTGFAEGNVRNFPQRPCLRPRSLGASKRRPASLPLPHTEGDAKASSEFGHGTARRGSIPGIPGASRIKVLATSAPRPPSCRRRTNRSGPGRVVNNDVPGNGGSKHVGFHTEGEVARNGAHPFLQALFAQALSERDGGIAVSDSPSKACGCHRGFDPTNGLFRDASGPACEPWLQNATPLLDQGSRAVTPEVGAARGCLDSEASAPKCGQTDRDRGVGVKGGSPAGIAEGPSVVDNADGRPALDVIAVGAQVSTCFVPAEAGNADAGEVISKGEEAHRKATADSQEPPKRAQQPSRGCSSHGNIKGEMESDETTRCFAGEGSATASVLEHEPHELPEADGDYKAILPPQPCLAACSIGMESPLHDLGQESNCRNDGVERRHKGVNTPAQPLAHPRGVGHSQLQAREHLASTSSSFPFVDGKLLGAEYLPVVGATGILFLPKRTSANVASGKILCGAKDDIPWQALCEGDLLGWDHDLMSSHEFFDASQAAHRLMTYVRREVDGSDQAQGGTSMPPSLPAKRNGRGQVGDREKERAGSACRLRRGNACLSTLRV